MSKLTITIATLASALSFSSIALADEAVEPQAGPQPPVVAPATPEPTVQAALVAPASVVATATPAAQPAAAPVPAEPTDEGSAWHSPVGRRFDHGFRVGWTYIKDYDKATRANGMSLKDEFGLKTPHMMLLGYEGFYRVVGHSWLNVVMVGNVTVAGLEQSKFIPAASGLIGFEFDRSFQLGVGVNLTPDPQSPSHMIAAGGWTPHVGSIQTPIHFFYVPDAEGNARMGATVGMNW